MLSVTRIQQLVSLAYVEKIGYTCSLSFTEQSQLIPIMFCNWEASESFCIVNQT